MVELPQNGESYIFLIKTDSYTGNFERKICGYCTGTIGDCEVGHHQAEDFKEEYGHDIVERFYSIIKQRSDDHGCYRPASIWETSKDSPNYVHDTYTYNDSTYDRICFNDSAIFFEKIPDADLIEIMKERAQEYCDANNIKLFGFELLKEIVTVQYENVEI